MDTKGRARAFAWLATLAVAYAAVALVWRDSIQQDGGLHFLLARWAWVHPEYLVGVWSRPLFTLVYSLPAQFGFPAAKLFSVAIAVATCALAWRTAGDPAVVPLLGLQGAFFLLAPDTLTETLFAAVLATALLLEQRDRPRAAAWVVSLLPLARPEGFVLAAVWGAWMAADARLGGPAKRAAWIASLAAGTAAWWLAALGVTGDPLWIPRNWPHNWSVKSPYGSGGALSIAAWLPEALGPAFCVPVVAGAAGLLRRRRGLWAALLGAYVALHAVLWAFGLFGSAGYARYLVGVSPILALAALDGWRTIAARLPRAAPALAAGGLALSAAFCAVNVDAHRPARDFRAIEDAASALPDVPVARLVWSQAYMCIVLDRDPAEGLGAPADPRELPPGTLVFWDADLGPARRGLAAEDFERAGFRTLVRRRYELRGRLLSEGCFGFGGPREQEMTLLYRAEAP